MNSIRRYVKRPVIIEAVRWDGTDETRNRIREWNDLNGGPGISRGINDRLVIRTLEGDMEANVGDYIIKGIKGEFYPCKPDIFRETYEEVIG